jgi:hypothetical protein
MFVVKYSSVSIPRHFIRAGMDKPPFPTNIQCLDMNEAVEVNRLQSLISTVDVSLPTEEIARTICENPTVKATLRNKRGFWPVVIGAPGIYRTE